MEANRTRFPAPRYAAFAWGVLVYNVFVVLYGAFVRATGSGAGCGKHWPLCNGEVIPRPQQIETIIEFAHRMTSGVTLILVAVLLIWTWRKYPRGSLMRWSSGGAALFTITEALVGAGIVLYGWVAHDTSVARAISVPIHLANTFLLLGFCAVTAWWASNGVPDRLSSHGPALPLLLGGVLGMLLLGGSGAITALGDTLFPSGSLAEGIQQDFNPASHFLIRMRIYHPAIAIAVGVYLALVTAWIRHKMPGGRLDIITTGLYVLYGLQIVLGVINIALFAPVWMQIIHLLVSCLVWITFVLMMTVVLSRLPASVSHQEVDHLVHAVTGK